MKIIFLLIFISSSSISVAQNNQQQKLKVFLDCRIGCDENYIRTEISFVDYVINRVAADVHILITARLNGSGGSSVQMIFYGQNNFKNRTDTLVYNQLPNATNNESRIQIAKRIRLGLLPFLTKISKNGPVLVNKEIINQIKKDSSETVSDKNVLSQPTKDNWNYWVYRFGVDGTYSADENYKSNSMNGYFSVNRTTDKLRVNFSVNGNTYNSTYKYENNGSVTNYKVTNTSYQLNHYLVKSISNHWSLGYEASYSNSTFSNNKSRPYLSAGIEYSIFPYKDVNNKFFTISYNLDVRHNKYYDTTIYNKLNETLFGHKMQVKLSLNQKWGYVNSGVTYSNFFKDWSLNNLLVTIDINVRVTGGLSFYVYTYGGLVHDQVYLVKGNATVQEILTRRRQLASGYNFYSGIGLSYRFGSILNNFVNPRFSNY